MKKLVAILLVSFLVLTVQAKKDGVYVDKLSLGKNLQEVEDKYAPEKFFTEEIYNTDECMKYCSAVFTITNPLKEPYKLNWLSPAFYDENDKVSFNIKSSKLKVGDIIWVDGNAGQRNETDPITFVEQLIYRDIRDDELLEPGNTVRIKLLGEKEEPGGVEWIPYLKLEKSDVKDLEADKIETYMGAWDFWGSGINPLMAFENTPASGIYRLTRFITHINISNITDLVEYHYETDNVNATMYDETLTLFYNFNNQANLGEGASLVVDASIFQNNGTPTNNTILTPTTQGRHDGAWNHSTSNSDWLGLDTGIKINGTIGATVAYWGRLYARNDLDAVLGDSAAYQGYINHAPQSNRFDVERSNANGDVARLNYDPALDVTIWHHYVLTFENYNTTIDNVTLFIDGVVEDDDTWATENYILATRLFRGYSNKPYEGFLDEFMIYNRTLTDYEIGVLYDSYLHRYDNQTFRHKYNTSGYETRRVTGYAVDSNGGANQTDLRNITIYDVVALEPDPGEQGLPLAVTLEAFINYTDATDPINVSLINSTGMIVNQTNGIAVPTTVIGHWTDLADNTAFTWWANSSIGAFMNRSVNYTFSTSDFPRTVLDTGGGCLTTDGYQLNFTVPAINDKVLLNFTGISIIRENGTNIDTDNQIFLVSDDSILIDTTTNKLIDLFIGGDHVTNTHPDATDSPDLSMSILLSNFTLFGNWYNLTYKWENDSTQWAFGAASSQTLTVFCDNFAPDTIDVKTLGLANLFISTKEPPTFKNTVDLNIDRIYQTPQSLEAIDYFMLNGSFTIIEINYTLNDYVGDFGASFFRIVRNINATLETIWQQRWYGLQVPKVDLENNSFAQYVIFTPTQTRIIVWDEIDGKIVRKFITLEDPTFTDILDTTDNVSMGFTSSYETSSVGVSYAVTEGTFTNITFTVFNDTGIGSYRQVHQNVVVGGANSGSLSYTVDNNNETFYLTATIYTSEITEGRSAADLETPRNTEQIFPYYDSFNLPETIMGVSKEKVYDGISMFFITTTAMLFTGLEVGSGGLVTVALILLLKFFGWFRSMSWGLAFFLSAMAGLYWIVSKRRKAS